MIRKHLYLNGLQIEKIEKEAKEKQLQVSEMIRRIIDKYFEEKENKS